MHFYDSGMLCSATDTEATSLQAPVPTSPVQSIPNLEAPQEDAI